jgi:hypothetical protein
MAEEYGRQNRLDFSQLVFKQVDRINELFVMCGIDVPTATASQSIYSGILALESMLIPKLSFENKQKYEEDKKKAKIDSNVPWDLDNVHATYRLLMSYLSQTGMLPARSQGFKSLETKEE